MHFITAELCKTGAFGTEAPINNFLLQKPGIIFAIIGTVQSEIQWVVAVAFSQSNM